MSKKEAMTFCDYIKGLFVEPLSVSDMEKVEEFYYSGWTIGMITAYFQNPLHKGYHLK
jgi:hypothetical protein